MQQGDPTATIDWLTSLVAADGLHSPKSIQQAALAACMAPDAQPTAQQLQELHSAFEAAGGAVPRVAAELQKLRQRIGDEGVSDEMPHGTEVGVLCMEYPGAGLINCCSLVVIGTAACR